jgi:hypothetical protein
MTEQIQNDMSQVAETHAETGATAKQVVAELFPNLREWEAGWETNDYRVGKVNEALKQDTEWQPIFDDITTMAGVVDLDNFWGPGHAELTKAVVMVGALGPAPYGLLRIAVMITNGHPLIDGFDEKMKSILLDTALSEAINDESESRDRARRSLAYFGEPIHRRIDREESASITKYKAAQQRLRAAFAHK